MSLCLCHGRGGPAPSPDLGYFVGGAYLRGGVGLGGPLDGLHSGAVEHHGLVPAAGLDLRAPCAQTPHDDNDDDDDDDARGNQTRTYTHHTAAAAEQEGR